MGRSVFLVAAAALQLASSAASAGPCDGVVEDTLAELRAGSAAPWSDETEALIRAAAGSACVKAVSGRYGTPAPAMAQEPLTTDEPVAAARDADPVDAADEEQDTAAENDDGSWSIGGLTVRSLSGSPAKKPYQRQREQNDD